MDGARVGAASRVPTASQLLPIVREVREFELVAEEIGRKFSQVVPFQGPGRQRKAGPGMSQRWPSARRRHARGPPHVQDSQVRRGCQEALRNRLQFVVV
eukprot:scaffold191_cov296-Prasinococcus_capsulatus_cf.AAC.2